MIPSRRSLKVIPSALSRRRDDQAKQRHGDEHGHEYRHPAGDEA
jgi:hypothetical protein